MTWQVSPEEWLLDFTAIPRGRSRAGDSLDVIDDRLRAILAPPPPKQTAVVIPTITASRAPRPAPAPPSPSRPASGPREVARSEPPAPARSEPSAPHRADPPAVSAPAPAAPPLASPGLSVELLPSSGGVVIPTLTRPGAPLDDDAEAIERLTPIGGTELGIPHDDAEDLMSAVASSAMLDLAPGPVAEAPEATEAPAEVAAAEPEAHEAIDEVEEALEMQEVVETRGARPAERPTLPPPPRPVSAPAPTPAAPVQPPAPPPAAGPPRPPPVAGPPRPPPVAGPPKPPEKRPAAVAPAPAPAPALRGESGAKKRRGWHDEVFGDFYAAISPIDADASADLDVAFVQKSLDLASGQRLLDVGCGDGRHAVGFARLGLDVTALDSSMPQLLRAARRNEASRFNFDLLHGDMRALPRDRAYDVVTCLGTSFGYFESDEQNRQVLQDMVEVLKPGGRLALQVLNRDCIMGVLPCRSWWQGRGCLVLDVADMNFFHGRIRVHRTVVFEDGRQFEHHISIRAYSVAELGRMLAQAGARVIEISGSRDTRGRFYGASSPEVWIFARREDG